MLSGWTISQIRVHTNPTANAATTVATVSSRPTSSLASTTRSRRGSMEKVTIAVRWLHSLVTSMIPSTGSSSEVTPAAIR